MMTVNESNSKPVPEEILTCGYCTGKIDKKEGYYHEEITDWWNESEGTGEDFYYHRECYRAKQEKLHEQNTREASSQ